MSSKHFESAHSSSTNPPTVNEIDKLNLTKSSNPDSNRYSHLGEATFSSNEKVQTRCSDHKPSSIPSNAFVASYEYKPRKSDELELKKGCKNLK